MDWNNVNLENDFERSRDMLDSYDFETLLLEVSCNLREITPETVGEQALLSIKQKYDTAIEILEANLENITKYAQAERATP
jgi:hypothetical protein